MALFYRDWCIFLWVLATNKRFGFNEFHLCVSLWRQEKENISQELMCSNVPCVLTQALQRRAQRLSNTAASVHSSQCGHSNKMPRFETLMENQHLKNSNHTIPVFMYSGNKLNFFFISVGHKQKLSRNHHHLQGCQKGGSFVKALNISSQHPHICSPKRNLEAFWAVGARNDSLHEFSAYKRSLKGQVGLQIGNRRNLSLC